MDPKSVLLGLREKSVGLSKAQTRIPWREIIKARFGMKAKMIPAAEVEEKIGHAVGGVCPFAVNNGVKIYLDESLKRFATVFPACGSSNSAIELTMQELEEYSGTREWVDICKGWEEEQAKAG